MMTQRRGKYDVLKVGAVGASNLIRRYQLPVKGTLVCSSCETDKLHALYEGGVCRKCHRAGAHSAPEAADPRTLGFEQFPETRQLVRRCDALIRERGISKSAFARLIGVEEQAFLNWHGRKIRFGGQLIYNDRISAGIERLLEEIDHEEIEHLCEAVAL